MPSPLSTPELLVLILTHLDPQTLLLCQRVNRTWATLIQTTPTLQEALFFRPSPNPDTNHPHHHHHHHHHHDALETTTPIPETKTYNPLLLSHFPSLFPAITSPSPLNTGNFPAPLSNLALIHHKSQRSAYLRQDASWRRMLTHQPPSRALGVIKITSAMGGETYRKYRIPGCVRDLDSLERWVAKGGVGRDESGENDSEEVEGRNDDQPGGLEEEGYLRMGLLFDFLISESILDNASIIWGGVIPEDLEDEYGPVLEGVFRRATEDADVVIYVHETVQCSMGGRRGRGKDSWKKNPRHKIYREYEKLGVSIGGACSFFYAASPEEEGDLEEYMSPRAWAEHAAWMRRINDRSEGRGLEEA
ncbi:F-box protein [Aspergillus ibericus CBS 121593]|uniref:F-box domain-containing protein n=1 Tax=Aspergillus ibericus CBS 121593 TaxID=1448316 RepID=A0A395GLV0_9EURO|nr:hypothetical protein BO80DRAFT_468538 [Aspergillus ibericus CBS 121593]RAK96491.1 hypothetical protein BO80DRAFT_468538 [Aspergillus ibericus CBS 121593]